MSTLEFSFHTSDAEIPEWNAVAAVGGLYSTAEWMRGFNPTWIAVRRGAEVLGVVACLTVKAPGEVPGTSEPDYFFTFDTNPDPVDAPVDELYPFVICGAVRGYQSNLLIRPDLDPQTRAEVLRTLVEAVRALARKDGARLVLWAYHYPSELEELLRVDSQLFGVFLEPDCVIPGGITFEDHCRRFPLLKKEGKKPAKADVRIEIEPFRKVFDATAELFSAQLIKYTPGYTVDVLRGILGRWLTPGLEERSRVYTAYQGDKIVGTSLVMVHGNTHYSRGAGALPEHRANGVFMNVTYVAPIKAALDAGARVHYGMNDVNTKLIRGCRLQQLWHVVDPLTPLSEPTRQRIKDMAAIRLAMAEKTLRQYCSEAEVLEQLGAGGKLLSTRGL